jgi:hypothetical protein
MFPSSTRSSTEPWERELSELGGAAAAVDMLLARRPVPKRAAAFTNFQIDENLHSVYLMCARVHAGRSSCPPPAG